MHGQIFNFAPLEDFLLTLCEKIRKGKKPTKDVDTTPSHAPYDDDDYDDGGMTCHFKH